MKNKIVAALAATALLGLAACNPAPKAEADAPFTWTDNYAQNGDVKIHYAAAGDADAPLVVMIHGFPDYWYTWRNLMDELDGSYRVVALDTRGYNLSDKPEGVDAYKTPNLVEDVAAVIKAEGRKSAVVVGHDWGANIAWNVALSHPDMVDRLVILSVPHPTNMSEQLRDDPAQQASSAYARNFQKPGSEDGMTAEGLAGWVKDPEAKPKYVEAFGKSSFSAMMNYYRANYPSGTGGAVEVPQLPPIQSPVLVISGEDDTALLPAGHNKTWERVAKDTTVMWLPGVGHWIEQDAGPLVNTTIHDWLDARPVNAADQKS